MRHSYLKQLITYDNTILFNEKEFYIYIYIYIYIYRYIYIYILANTHALSRMCIRIFLFSRNLSYNQ